MHHIGLFVSEEHEALDLAGPLAAFTHVSTVTGSSPYALHLISQAGGSVTGNTGLAIETKPFRGPRFGTVIFIGGDSICEKNSQHHSIAHAGFLHASAITCHIQNCWQ